MGGGAQIWNEIKAQIREQYEQQYLSYQANGGTGSFEDWLAEGMPEDDQAAQQTNRFVLGTSDGGPGEWRSERLRDRDAASYQSAVTGAPIDQQYVVSWDGMLSGELSFDSYDPVTDTPIDAKFYTRNWPRLDLPFSVNEVLRQARDQQGYMEDSGTAVEWVIASQHRADVIQQIFDSAIPPITVKIRVVLP